MIDAPVELIRVYQNLSSSQLDPALGASDPDPDQEHQHSSDHHLKSGAEKRCVHLAVSNPADQEQLNGYDQHRDYRGGVKILNEIR
ncbi:MAG: hypothetical protein QOG27_539 [Verrucomicrobiota bacterium]